MLALIDADIVAYRTAAVNEKGDFALARWQADQLISRIIEDVNASDWKLYLSGSNNNFRSVVYPEYKANRRDMPKPRHLEALREYLVLDWDAQLVDGYEADDAIGIQSCNGSGGSIICSIDKDLLQIPGQHYDFVKRRIIDVSDFDGIRQFYWQCLVGDSTDNIKGCPGIGPVKAELRLKDARNRDELFEATLGAYKDQCGSTAEQQLDLTAQLVYIWRQEDDNWQRLLKPPIESVKQEGEVTQSSLPKTQPISSESTTVETPDGSQ